MYVDFLVPFLFVGGLSKDGKLTFRA